MSLDTSARTLLVEEPLHAPPLSLLLGISAMLPTVAAAGACWLLQGPIGDLARDAGVLWAGAILSFLAGVRRGLSFRTPGGATVTQIATMLWLFLLGVSALATLAFRVAPLLLLFGYASLAILDPLAARRGETPLFFARLRPLQMLMPIGALVAIMLRDVLYASSGAS